MVQLPACFAVEMWEMWEVRLSKSLTELSGLDGVAVSAVSLPLLCRSILSSLTVSLPNNVRLSSEVSDQKERRRDLFDLCPQVGLAQRIKVVAVLWRENAWRLKNSVLLRPPTSSAGNRTGHLLVKSGRYYRLDKFYVSSGTATG